MKAPVSLFRFQLVLFLRDRCVVGGMRKPVLCVVRFTNIYCMYAPSLRTGGRSRPNRQLVSLFRFQFLVFLRRDSFVDGGMRKSVMSVMSKGMLTTMFHGNQETQPSHWRTRKQYTTQVTRLPHRGAC